MEKHIPTFVACLAACYAFELLRKHFNTVPLPGLGTVQIRQPGPVAVTPTK